MALCRVRLNLQFSKLCSVTIENALRSFLRCVGSFLRKASIKVLSGRFQSSLIITVLNSAPETAVRPFDNAKASRLGGLNSPSLPPKKWRATKFFFLKKPPPLPKTIKIGGGLSPRGGVGGARTPRQKGGPPKNPPGGRGGGEWGEDTRLHRKVALKILPSELAANKDRMRRFEQEAQAAAALNHPNIAHIYEIGESGGVNFMAMEFVDGVTLGEKIHGERTELKKLLNVINGDTNERE